MASRRFPLKNSHSVVCSHTFEFRSRQQGGHRLALAVLALNFIGLAGSVFAQSLPTPGSPSIPLSPAALANGVQSRITTQYGIEFVTIGAPGNAAWPGNGSSNDRAAGKGGVGYEYRMGRFEVTTTQWAQFLSAARGRPASEAIPFLSNQNYWGGMVDPTYHGPGTRYIAQPGFGMTPVGNISWRTAAIYCNWLHNNQSTDRSAFMGGAYDVSTFGSVGQSSVFTDQLTRSPGAKFFIPSISEWVKAAHYDPNRNGPGQGGYWQYSITSDTAPVYAPPGILVNGRAGQSNSYDAFSNPQFPGYSPFAIPLGAYSTVQSPWGLLDTASGTQEWEEDAAIAAGGSPVARWSDGSAWGGNDGFAPVLDRISSISNDYPSADDPEYGFRIAAAIPAPTEATLFILGITCSLRRRRMQ